MPYIGNYHITGDTASNFKLLDDISSYTETIDGSSSSIVSSSADTIKILQHRFVTGQRVTYSNGGGSDIGGLTDGGVYYIIKYDRDSIRLATTAVDATNNNAIGLSVGSGSAHTLNVAFDSVNTTFRPTYNNGTHARITDPGQLTISINGVVQKPSKLVGLTDGFAIDAGGNIKFATAPTTAEIFWGQVVANSLATFDIADNQLDNFTGDGVTTDFTLSQSVPNNASVVVTIDGVVQHATDRNGNRAYSVYDTVLAFSAAPPSGVEIQVRHIGFSSPVNSDVTSFYGRVGPVTIVDSDPVVAIQSGGLGIGTVRTINFVGSGNSIRQVGDTVEVTISGSGGGGGSGVIYKETFNVTSNRTVFSLSNSYNTGYVDVYLNGVRLSASDFTETDSTTITLSEPAIAGDIVDVVINSSVVENTILNSSVDNLIVTTSFRGVLGAGEETVSTSSGFLSEVVSMPLAITVSENATVAPKAGHDITFVKYSDVIIESTYDLTIDSDDFMIDVYDLSV